MSAKPVQGFDYARNYDDFRNAIHAALRGPERKEIPIITYDRDERDDDSHGFNIKPVKVTREGDLYIIDGSEGRHLSHRKGTAKDDQIYYQVIVNRNNLEAMRIEWSIKEGGLLNTVKDALVAGVKEVIDFCVKNPELCKKGVTSIAGGVALAGPLLAGPLAKDYHMVIDHYQHLLIVPKDSWQGAAAFLISCIAHLAVVEGETGDIVVQ